MVKKMGGRIYLMRNMRHNWKFIDDIHVDLFGANEADVCVPVDGFIAAQCCYLAHFAR